MSYRPESDIQLLRFELSGGCLNIYIYIISKIYRSQGVQIHNRHIEIIVRQITSKVLVSEDGMSNVFLPGELIGLFRAERTGRALKEAICYRAILLGITKASLNTQSFISPQRMSYRD